MRRKLPYTPGDTGRMPPRSSTIRNSLARLFDSDTFTEIDSRVMPRTIEFNMDRYDLTGDGMVVGFGEINGRTVYCYASDASQLGGSIGEMGAMKVAKVMDLAYRNGKPLVSIWNSGGARIQEGIRALEGCGRIFRRNIRYSGVIPQISLIIGACAGAASYSPALTDFIIQERHSGLLFITGPKVVKASIGQDSTFESLGGVNVHAKQSGLTHFIAEDEDHALAQARALLGYIPDNSRQHPPQRPQVAAARRSLEFDIATLIPKSPNKAYDMVKLVNHLTDEPMLQVHEKWAQNIVVGFARFNGCSVGIVANQPRVMAGAIDSAAALKASRFIRFCDCFNLPIIVFVDVPGFLPGEMSEKEGIIRNGAKLLYAFCEATVPRISMAIRKAYGGAHIVMNSNNILSDFNFAWPTSEFAVMGPEGAVDILYRREIEAEPGRRDELLSEYRARYTNPEEAARMGFVDQIIEPRDTRRIIIDCLKLLRDKDEMRSRHHHGNMPL